MKAHAIPTIFIHHDSAALRQSAAVSELQHNTMIKEIMTVEKQEAEQAEETQEVKVLFQTKRIPANVLCGESAHGKKLPGHLHEKKEEEQLWESWKQMQEMDIIAVTVGSEDEEEAQCSLLNWRQTEENIKGEPATCSSAKVIQVEPNGDVSEGPEAANTSTQQDTDGEETDCSDTEDSEDWREPFSQSEAQSEDLAMSCEKFQTSEVKKKNNAKLKSLEIEKLIVCDVCGKRFSNRAYLKVHMRIHTEEKSFGCEVCGKRFSYKGHLKVHTTTHTGEKPFDCDICGKKYTQKTSLNLHMRKHRGETPFGCSVCGQKFTQKSSLSRHVTIHKGEKPYSCDVCGKKFTFKMYLNSHILIHTEGKPFECDVCKKTFTLRSYLNKHMTIHTREKPFRGDVFSKTFSSKKLPTTKKQNHPRKKLYECEVCGKSFGKSLNLKKHLKIHAGV